MAASYPGDLKSFSTWVDKQDDVSAALVNAIQDEVVAIETELGTDVAGSMTDLKSRLAIALAADGAIAKGTSEPVSPAPVEGQMFYNTDENTFKTYDGASWNAITTHGISLYTSDDTFTVPTGVTKVYLTMVGGGGGGGGAAASGTNYGGGGASGAWLVNYPFTVTPAAELAIQVGDAGAGGAAGDNDGSNGQATIFDTGGSSITCAGGNGGKSGSVHTGGVAVGGYNAGTPPAGGGYTIVSGTGGTATGTTAGGGGGGTPFGSGGAGSTGNSVGADAAANTGAGGGGACSTGDPYAGGSGGSGFVMVLY